MSAARRKGTAAESAVAAYLRANGFPYADRAPMRGKNDCGDIDGIPGCVIEVKNHQAMDLAGWLDEAEAEAARAVRPSLPSEPAARSAWRPLGIVWHKRKGKASPGDWYVTMTGETFAELLGDAKGR